MITTLSIETSCDETGIAVLRKDGDAIEVLASAVASQVDVHAVTGGVVPEVAAREHVAVINPLIEKVLQDSFIDKGTLAGIPDLDAIAVTIGPGLIPALVVGVQAARTLAYGWEKPLVPVHHIEGHIYSALLMRGSETSYQLPVPESFPALALIVSGGHTMLIKITDHLQYEVLGQTRDDAAGEAFDKVARLLDLPYPGGPHLSELAAKGDPAAFDFTRPMHNSGDLDFSFSGLKTEVLYKVREIGVDFRENIAASFQQAVVDSLIIKTRQALRLTSLTHSSTYTQRDPEKSRMGQGKLFRTLLLAGGVAANKLLRSQVTTLAAEENIELRIAPPELCGDNAVMIGQVGLLAFEAGRTSRWNKIDAAARLDIEKMRMAIRD